jgi:hypothetical protein
MMPGVLRSRQWIIQGECCRSGGFTSRDARPETPGFAAGERIHYLTGANAAVYLDLPVA